LLSATAQNKIANSTIFPYWARLNAMVSVYVPTRGFCIILIQSSSTYSVDKPH